MGPKTQFFLAIAAALIGFFLLLGLALGDMLLANPVKVFLGVLLLVGGAMFLWLRKKSAKTKKPESEDIKKPESEDILSQYLRK
jgi:threonine/homoserine/homoserine lactone efflux protein